MDDKMVLVPHGWNLELECVLCNQSQTTIYYLTTYYVVASLCFSDPDQKHGLNPLLC